MKPAQTLEKEIRTAYDPKTADYLIRNLHKPLNIDLLKTAHKMMAGHKGA